MGVGHAPSEATRDAFDEENYNRFERGMRTQWWFLMRYENSQADTRYELDVLRAQNLYRRRVRQDGCVPAELLGDKVQFADRIERCALCEAPYTDSEQVEAEGGLYYDLCPRCRQFPDEDLLLNAIDRGIDDEGLDRLIEHYATLKENRQKGIAAAQAVRWGGHDGEGS